MAAGAGYATPGFGLAVAFLVDVNVLFVWEYVCASMGHCVFWVVYGTGLSTLFRTMPLVSVFSC